jgi:hypothetical protein
MLSTPTQLQELTLWSYGRWRKARGQLLHSAVLATDEICHRHMTLRNLSYLRTNDTAHFVLAHSESIAMVRWQTKHHYAWRSPSLACLAISSLFLPLRQHNTYKTGSLTTYLLSCDPFPVDKKWHQSLAFLLAISSPASICVTKLLRPCVIPMRRNHYKATR